MNDKLHEFEDHEAHIKVPKEDNLKMLRWMFEYKQIMEDLFKHSLMLTPTEFNLSGGVLTDIVNLIELKNTTPESFNKIANPDIEICVSSYRVIVEQMDLLLTQLEQLSDMFKIPMNKHWDPNKSKGVADEA